MDYNKFKIRDCEIDSNTVVMTREEQREAREKIEARFGEGSIEKVVPSRDGKGIMFLGAYGLTLGKFEYNERDGKFTVFYSKIYERKLKEVIKKEKRNKAIRKFVICRVVPYTLAGTMAVAGVINAVEWAKNSIFIGNEPETTQGVNVANPNAISLDKAPVPVVLAWADHALGDFYDQLDKSEYRDYVISQYDDLYQNVLIPMHSSYENYYEMKEMGLPDDMLGGSMQSSLEKVMEYAGQLNHELPKDLKFENTVYSQTIIRDAEADSKHASDVQLYIPLDLLEGSEYSINNLPSDAFIHEGIVYVSISHLHNLNNGMSLN